MAFYPPKLKVPLLVVAMGTLVLSVGAQQSGQSIIFSTPQSDDAQSATPSLAPQNSQMPVLPGTLQAPMSVFNSSAPNDVAVLPPPQSNSAEQQRMKKMLDDRKNWTLMTPAEMLGVMPTEKLLQPSERDAMGRENPLPAGSTNNWQNDHPDSPWNFSRDKDRANPFDSRHYGMDDSARNLDRFPNGQRNGDASANQNENVSWDSFNTPAQQMPVKQNLEQLAAMERFRQLLAPGSASATPSPDSQFFPVPKTVLDPNITQPDFVPNPAGASFTPLSSEIGKPTGLAPLPGIVNSTLQPDTTPAWTPQPPPWLLQEPQPFVMPKQKF